MFRTGRRGGGYRISVSYHMLARFGDEAADERTPLGGFDGAQRVDDSCISLPSCLSLVKRVARARLDHTDERGDLACTFETESQGIITVRSVVFLYFLC